MKPQAKTVATLYAPALPVAHCNTLSANHNDAPSGLLVEWLNAAARLSAQQQIFSKVVSNECTTFQCCCAIVVCCNIVSCVCVCVCCNLYAAAKKQKSNNIPSRV